MINGFTLKDGALQQQEILSQDDLTEELIWIDLVSPTDLERKLVEDYYHLELPIPSDLEEIEASARFYKDHDGLHIHSLFLNSATDFPTKNTVAFTINKQHLISIHEEDLSSFRLFRLKARHPERNELSPINNAYDLLIALHGNAVEQLADLIESIYSQLEKISPHVLMLDRVVESEEMPMDDLLSEITIQEDINGKARLALMDTRRSLNFLLRSRLIGNDEQEVIREIMQDIESLTGHTAFLFEKINFLLDAAMGKISLEQSRIIKIFSIASVVFLPPTLIASIYGMNFAFMPELTFKISYPLSLGLMVLSGIAPYLFFKRKGWL